jgi:hypothetical protein|tara:strand:+ start:451 stop:615 length:165 start_codon:yes stop_codon:yes gene_type:complete
LKERKSRLPRNTRHEADGSLAATMLLNNAVLKGSFAGYALGLATALRAKPRSQL